MNFDDIFVCFNLNTNCIDFRGSYEECVRFVNEHDYEYEVCPEDVF